MAPCPIRSVSKLEENCPAVFSSNPNSLLMPMSYMQNMFMQGSDAPMQKKAKVGKNFDAKSKELLFRIWSSRDQKIVQAQRALNVSEIVFQVPSEVSDYDVIRLVSEDLVKNKGNRRVAFTERGKVALGLQIMSEPSEFNKKRTRDKFVFSQASELIVTKEDAKKNPALLGNADETGLDTDPVVNDINNESLDENNIGEPIDFTTMDPTMVQQMMDKIQNHQNYMNAFPELKKAPARTM